MLKPGQDWLFEWELGLHTCRSAVLIQGRTREEVQLPLCNSWFIWGRALQG